MIELWVNGKRTAKTDATIYLVNPKEKVTIKVTPNGVAFCKVDQGCIEDETRGSWESIRKLIREGLPYVAEDNTAKNEEEKE